MNHFLNRVYLTTMALLCFPSISAAQETISAKSSRAVAVFGELPDGTQIKKFTLKNANGLQLSVMEYGATMTELLVPDARGQRQSVVLGTDNQATYLDRFPAASVIGRYANRIHNAEFELDGKTIHITANSGANHIHGGKVNFAKLKWFGQVIEDAEVPSVIFRYHSADGEEGFPGNLAVSVTYSLDDQNRVALHYAATTDQPTVVNLTNHAYFNLAGPGGDVLDHELQVYAEQFTVADDALIPTGELSRVVGTPLDFRESHRIGERIEQLSQTSGYDHNFVLDNYFPSANADAALRIVARVKEPRTGRVLECSTTEPGLQLYTANGFNGNPYPKHGGFCLETQHYPDSPNHPEFPSTIVRPGEKWESTTVFRFKQAN